jgi:hypothetical protein
MIWKCLGHYGVIMTCKLVGKYWSKNTSCQKQDSYIALNSKTAGMLFDHETINGILLN